MSGQRARSAVPAEHRSALPTLPGLPWWAAVLLAVTATAIGFAFDAGSGAATLGTAFTVCYVTGCVLAVLAVRQSGLFSAVIQPALILFIAVPTAYFLFHGSEIKGVKDILINCGYPLIERFPLMFFTAATVLIIGIARVYLNSVARRHEPEEATDSDGDAPDSRAARRAARAAAAAAAAPAVETPARRSRSHTGERSRSIEDDDAPRPRRQRTTAAEPRTASRSRRDRSAETEIIEAVSARPRRPRPPVDQPGEPRRRSRADEPRERRNLPPVERRTAPDRSERSERSERSQRRDAPARRPRSDRPERRPLLPDYEDFDGYRPPAGAGPSSSAGAGSGGTHHPVSRVRYRSTEDDDRTPPRRARKASAESWEYDL